MQTQAPLSWYSQKHPSSPRPGLRHLVGPGHTSNGPGQGVPGGVEVAVASARAEAGGAAGEGGGWGSAARAMMPGRAYAASA